MAFSGITSGMKHWEDLLEAAKKCKARYHSDAVDGPEKWPIQFYPALLMSRILGKDGMASAYKGQNGGFVEPDVVKAWKMYKELCELEPSKTVFGQRIPPSSFKPIPHGRFAFEGSSTECAWRFRLCPSATRFLHSRRRAKASIYHQPSDRPQRYLLRTENEVVQ